MKVSDAFPSKYLAAADLAGRTVVVVIDSILVERVSEEPKKDLPVLYFRDKNKGLALNKTNATTIEGMHGDEMDDWIGKRISLWPTQTEFNGRAVPCIRVRLGSTQPVAEAEEFIEKIAQPAQPEPGVTSPSPFNSIQPFAPPADDIPF